MSDRMIEEFSKRLGVQDKDTLSKSNEMLRLINLKTPLITQTAKIIISIDCASSLCNTELDRETVIQLSGLKKKEYVKQKELIEKRLDLAKKLSLTEICAQLEISDSFKKDATRLLVEYEKKHAFVENISDNIQYLTMAIYQSCRLRKSKNNNIKTKLIQLSRLNGTMWKRMEEEWTNWINKDFSVINHMKSGIHSNIQADTKVNFVGTNPTNDDGNIAPDECEMEYGEWSERIIQRAKKDLKNFHEDRFKRNL